MTTAKHNARLQLLGRRKAMSPNERRAADEATWIALRGFLTELLAEGATVAAYRPFGAEPCATLEPELPERLAQNWRIMLPVTLPGNDLDWTTLDSEVTRADVAQPNPPADSWDGVAMTGPKGTEEVAQTRGVEAISQAEAVIVPGLAVSHVGMRLGRGGGSYDRALTRLRPGVPVVALLRDGEFGFAVPAEAHDRPVTGVITPTDGFLTTA